MHTRSSDAPTKTITASLLFLLLAFARSAVATEVAGEQSGTWTLENSPYVLVDDVHVAYAQSLTIEPGVVVVGMEHRKLTVGENSTLHAVGTEDRGILFTAADPDAGWRGIRLENASDLSRIEHCTIEYSKAEGDIWLDFSGGGLLVQESSPTISDSIFRYNSTEHPYGWGSGGALCTMFSEAVIENNLFHDNVADSGGAIATAEYGSPVIRRNVFVRNRSFNGGGGLYLAARSSPLIESNVIIDNRASGYGGGGICSWTSYIFYGTYPTIRNNLISHNTTDAAGGGLYLRYDRALVNNNTIVNNSATVGGGVYVINIGSSVPVISNCVIWGNTGAQIWLEQTTVSQVRVRYSVVENGFFGNENSREAPRFVDPDGADDVPGTIDDDFRLAEGSPCIDSGDKFALGQAVMHDLDGSPRYVDDAGTPDTGTGSAPIVDRGAYEFQGTSLGLLAPSPGVAGQWNEIEVRGGTPGRWLFQVAGSTEGSVPIPGCESTLITIGDPKLLGRMRSDANGEAILRFFVPPRAAGRTVLFQVLERSSCRVSRSVEHAFH